jgi:hypothetical protein
MVAGVLLLGVTYVLFNNARGIALRLPDAEDAEPAVRDQQGRRHAQRTGR